LKEIKQKEKEVNMSEAKYIFDKLFSRWRTSLDPVIAFRTGEFKEKEERIVEDMEAVRKLFYELELWFLQEECQHSFVSEPRLSDGKV
jgi:hypothetical protein